MKHLYIPRPGDREEIIRRYKRYLLLNGPELIKAYNRREKCGLVGVHMQALDTIAMHWAFKKIFFDKSPINIEQKIIISLTGQIDFHMNYGWVYKEKTKLN